MIIDSSVMFDLFLGILACFSAGAVGASVAPGVESGHGHQLPRSNHLSPGVRQFGGVTLELGRWAR